MNDAAPGLVALLEPSSDAPRSSGCFVKRTSADDARLRAMVDAHFDFIWRALRGLGVAPSATDDAAQNVFWIAAQKLSTVPLGSERSFLFATARRVAANARRKVTRSPEQLDEEAIFSHADAAANPEQRMANEQSLRVLEQVLDALGDELREVFVLFELEGLTMAEIATMLDLPPGTVASRLRRARDEFASVVKRFQASGGAP